MTAVAEGAVCRAVHQGLVYRVRPQVPGAVRQHASFSDFFGQSASCQGIAFIAEYSRRCLSGSLRFTRTVSNKEGGKYQLHAAAVRH